jgi:ABC-2 type transport system permease protein
MTMATTTRSPRASLQAWRSRGFGRLVLTEGKVWMRGSDIFWALLFPTILLVGQAVIAPELRQIAHGDTWAGTPFYGTSVINVILPAMLAMPIGITALTILPATFGGFREKGMLRRFSATPMRPQSMFAAHFIINVTMALAGALLAVIVTSFLFKVVVPNNVAMVVLGFVLGMAAMMALGALIAARVSRASTGTAIGNIIFFPLLLTSGVFTVLEPAWLYQIARVTPLGAASQVMSYGWLFALADQGRDSYLQHHHLGGPVADAVQVADGSVQQRESCRGVVLERTGHPGGRTVEHHYVVAHFGPAPWQEPTTRTRPIECRREGQGEPIIVEPNSPAPRT